MEQGTPLQEHKPPRGRRWRAVRSWYAHRFGRPIHAAPHTAFWSSAALRKALVIPAQIVGLFLLSQAGYFVVERLHLPLPGNLVGMLLLLALLLSGAVRLAWIEAGASLLVRHLAFFFVPITVGLMGFAQMFLDHGLAILTTLLVSAALGICIAGFCSQGLSRRRDREQP